MEKRIKILEQDKYLAIPIKAKQEKTKVFIIEQDNRITELNIPVGEDEKEYSYDFLAYLPIDAYKGKEIVLRGDVSASFLEAIQTTSFITRKRENRPSIHFTPDYG